MMKQIGIVGLGDISQKAYLPYMRQLEGVCWHLFTRNQAVLEQVASLLGQVKTYESLEALLDVDLDGVFIHVATVAHQEIAQQFLKKGIPVYMDKPLTENFAETQALYDLAHEQGTFLMTGFNRRFAPRVLKMTELADKRRIVVEKNDVNRPGELQFKLFDFFIHPLDIALYLADGQLQAGQFHYHVTQDNLLSQVTVTLQTDQETIIASMNLQAGSRREVMEVQTLQATYHLENLDELTIFTKNRQTRENFTSWDTTLYKRGFETIIEAFLQAIDTGENPVSPETSLLSHYLCHQINQADKASGILDVKLPL